jgi:hypothetical protein
VRWRKWLGAVAALLVGALAAPAWPQAALTLQTGQQLPVSLDADLLRAHAAESIAVRWQRGEATENAQFTGLKVRSLLTLLGVPSGRELRGAWLRATVTAVGAEGYEVSFGIGELDPSLTGRRAIVAWERDGAALDTKEGPLRLIIEADQRPSRSVRQLVALRVTRPADHSPQ